VVPQANECNFLGCGPWLHCEATALSASSSHAAPTSLGPFQAAEVVAISESACSAPTCYLAITDARGTWFVHEVTTCAGAEGVSAELETLAVRVVDHKLVWQYAHYMRMDEVTNERVTVECGAGSSAPECSISTE